jgi:aryl-alcohol dehydrogenase-like predicted oxidoreductase
VTFAFPNGVNLRRLGRSTLDITPLGLGTWAIGGGDWIMGWGPQPDGQSIATVRRALHRGINWIDTSATYGLGHAETIVARALRYVPREDRPYVFTKGGVVWDELGNVSCDLAPRTITRQVEDSLRRLGVDAIDLFHLDLPAPDCPIAPRFGSPTAAWEAIAALQETGKIRFIGVANPRAVELETLHAIAPVTSVQVRYSLLRRDAERDVLPLCARLGVGVIAVSSMESGLLTGALTPERRRSLPHNDWRRWCPAFDPAASLRAMHTVEELRLAGERCSCATGAVALGWALAQPHVTAVCAGARRPAQIDEIVTAGDLCLTRRETDDLESAVPPVPSCA